MWKNIIPLRDVATERWDSLEIACITLVLKEVSGYYAALIVIWFDKDIFIFLDGLIFLLRLLTYSFHVKLNMKRSKHTFVSLVSDVAVGLLKIQCNEVVL